MDPSYYVKVEELKAKIEHQRVQQEEKKTLVENEASGLSERQTRFFVACEHAKQTLAKPLDLNVYHPLQLVSTRNITITFNPGELDVIPVERTAYYLMRKLNREFDDKEYQREVNNEYNQEKAKQTNTPFKMEPERKVTFSAPRYQDRLPADMGELPEHLLTLIQGGRGAGCKDGEGTKSEERKDASVL